jgi:hypothetical protein
MARPKAVKRPKIKRVMAKHPKTKSSATKRK